MLTKTDLQAIKEVIDERLEVKLEEKLESKLDQNLQSIKDDINSFKKQLEPISSMQKDIRSISKNVKILIDHFDKRDVRLQKRVKRIEDHLELPL